MNTPPACADYVGVIVRVADGAADEADHARLRDHVSQCAACAHALTVQRQAREELAARPTLEASSSFRARVRQRIEEEHAGSLAGLLDFRTWTWRLVPVTAALALAAALGIASTTPSTSTENLPMDEVAAGLPVSAALYSTSVTESSLLSLMLQANVDDRLGAFEENR